jgi:hypothetical protein
MMLSSIGNNRKSPAPENEQSKGIDRSVLRVDKTSLRLGSAILPLDVCLEYMEKPN